MSSVYIEHFNILTVQYGVRHELGTQYALIDLLTVIYKAFDDTKICIISGKYAFYTITFDTANHDMLSQTLEDIGIRDIFLKIFENYQKDHKL